MSIFDLIRAVTVVVGLLTLHAGAFSDVKETAKPWFCRDMECPSFKTLKNYSNYELREYEPSK